MYIPYYIQNEKEFKFLAYRSPYIIRDDEERYICSSTRPEARFLAPLFEEKRTELLKMLPISLPSH